MIRDAEKWAADLEIAEWAMVPDSAILTYRRVLPVVPILTKLALAPSDRVYWNPDREEAWVWAADRAGRPDNIAVVDMPPPIDSWVLVKAASFLAGARENYDWPQRLVGGPNTLTNMLAGGLVGAGVGWGAGKINDMLLPDDHFDKGRNPGRYAMIGAGLGALPSAMRGAVNMQIPEAGTNGLHRFFGNYGYHKYASIPDIPVFVKEAIEQYANESSFMFADKIPVDRFNRTIWQDVGMQPGQLPPQTAALLSGLIAGTGALTGKDDISISDLAWTAGTTAAKGYIGGLATAKILGALAGLKPASQQKLQQAGMWGGLLVGAANALRR